jgi:hypothetical protein
MSKEPNKQTPTSSSSKESGQLSDDREELLRRIRGLRGCLPADFKFNRDEANAR